LSIKLFPESSNDTLSLSVQLGFSILFSVGSCLVVVFVVKMQHIVIGHCCHHYIIWDWDYSLVHISELLWCRSVTAYKADLPLVSLLPLWMLQYVMFEPLSVHQWQAVTTASPNLSCPHHYSQTIAMVPSRSEWRGETDNRATPPVGYCPSTASFFVRPYCKNARPDRCQEYHNCFPFGELEETTRTSSNYVVKTIQQDLRSNNLISPWMRRYLWLRIVHSGDWCLRLALRTPSGACHTRRRRIAVAVWYNHHSKQMYS